MKPPAEKKISSSRFSLSPERVLHVLGCVAFSGAVTVGAFLVDRWNTERVHVAYQLRMARQIALDADPESRPAGKDIQVFFQSTAELDEANPERYEFIRAKQEFDFIKLTDPTKKTGIRVVLAVPFLGFLGTSTLWAHFLALGILGCFFALFFHLAIKHSPVQLGELLLRRKVSDWVTHANREMVNFSVALKNLVKSGLELVTGATRAKSGIDQVVAMLSRAEQTRFADAKLLEEVSDLIFRLESRLMGLKVDAGRLGPSGIKLARDAQEILDQIKWLGKAAQSITENSAQVGKTIGSSLQIATESRTEFEVALAKGSVLSKEVKKATEAMTGHAAHVKDLNRVG